MVEYVVRDKDQGLKIIEHYDSVCYYCLKECNKRDSKKRFCPDLDEEQWKNEEHEKDNDIMLKLNLSYCFIKSKSFNNWKDPDFIKWLNE